MDLYEFSSDDQTLVLADGGLWNNLATSWHTERAQICRQLWHSTPVAFQSDVDLHLVVDACAPVTRWCSTILTTPIIGWARGVYRSYQALLQSTVTHHREQLGWGSQWTAGGRISHVNTQRNPQDVSPRTALLDQLGQDKQRWQTTAERARKGRTTLFGLERETAVMIVAHAYGLTSAHLTDGFHMPFSCFSDPIARFG
jgi:hypothetical protein